MAGERVGRLWASGALRGVGLRGVGIGRKAAMTYAESAGQATGDLGGVEDDVIDVDADVVEGEAVSGPSVGVGSGVSGEGSVEVVTVGQAASEYFEWAEEREAQRRKRNVKHGKAELDGVEFDEGARVSVARFVSHFAAQTAMSKLTPQAMESFQEGMGANATDVGSRLHPVKAFLRFCWKPKGYTGDNLGNFCG